MSLVERSLASNTLICLLQALENRETRVELRNETSIYGKILMVDAYMNISLSNVIYTASNGKQTQFSDFFVQGRQIRFVHIPDDVNIIQAIEQRLAVIRKVRSWREPQTQKILMAKRREQELANPIKSKDVNQLDHKKTRATESL